jgi:hypothetical protein
MAGRGTIICSLLAVLLLSVLGNAIEPQGSEKEKVKAVMASASQSITYQGVLKDASENPIPNAALNVIFRVYDEQDAGDLLWQEKISVTTDRGGYFNAILSDLDLPSHSQYYLSLQVEGDAEMSPRQILRLPGPPLAGGSDPSPPIILEDSHWDDDGDVIWPAEYWGISHRPSSGTDPNSWYGNMAHTHINLGVNSQTGKFGYNRSYSTVGGGCQNISESEGTTVSGGQDNEATGKYSTISGGRKNIASGGSAVVGGGYGNMASSSDGTVGGGKYNLASGAGSAIGGGTYDTTKAAYGGVFAGYDNLAGDGSGDSAAFVGGGSKNKATGKYTVVSGGWTNSADGNYNTISGGKDNTIWDLLPPTAATIGGGEDNEATGSHSTVGGGTLNTASGSYSVVAGGAANIAGGQQSFVGGGNQNNASGFRSTIGGGKGNDVSGDYSTIPGGISNGIIADKASVGGGQNNNANGDYSVASGGYGNTVGGDYSTAGGGSQNSASANYSTVGGGQSNTASYAHATVGGGFDNSSSNTYGTVGGGQSNIASSTHATVGGGLSNTASGQQSSVIGGWANTAGGYLSAVGGGYTNSASAQYSVVPGGQYNVASGLNSFAAGRRAKAEHEGAFVWADYTPADFASTGINQFLIRASGGVGIGIANPGSYQLYVDGDVKISEHTDIDGNLFVDGHIDVDGKATMGPDNTNGGNYSFVFGVENDAGSSAEYATIGGGHQNEVTGPKCTVSGGWVNAASGTASMIGGGTHNSATEDYAAVCGGYSNENAGANSAIPGGFDNTLTLYADYSMAFGVGVYVNSPKKVALFESSTHGQLGINRDDNDGGIGHPIHVGTSTSNGNGAYLTNGGTWTDGSSRTFKENGEIMEKRQLLSKISGISIEVWNFKDSDERHIGPYAEDFVAAFDVGTIRESDGQRENQYLAASDVAGVALAGVQALLEKIERLEARIAEL